MFYLLFFPTHFNFIKKKQKQKNCTFCYLVIALVHTGLQEHFEHCTVLLCMCTENWECVCVCVCVCELVKPLKGQHFYSVTTTRVTSFKNNDETVFPHYNCLIAVWGRLHLLYWLVISAVPGLKALGLSDTCSSWVIRSPLVSDSVVTSRQCQGYTRGLSAYSQGQKNAINCVFSFKNKIK